MLVTVTLIHVDPYPEVGGTTVYVLWGMGARPGCILVDVTGDEPARWRPSKTVAYR
jgi:hypothetical protein